MNKEQLPAVQALDDLESAVVSDKDRDTLEAWQAEIEAEREQAVGSMRPVPELHQNQDGSVVTVEEHQQAVANGDNPSGPYDSGRRA